VSSVDMSSSGLHSLMQMCCSEKLHETIWPACLPARPQLTSVSPTTSALRNPHNISFHFVLPSDVKQPFQSRFPVFSTASCSVCCAAGYGGSWSGFFLFTFGSLFDWFITVFSQCLSQWLIRTFVGHIWYTSRFGRGPNFSI